MKKDNIRLFHLSGVLADQILWGDFFNCVNQMTEEDDFPGNNEVITDADGCIYAQRSRFGGWTFSDKARANCQIYQAVLKIAVQASVEEQVN
ncbi:MAG: hypothetical protein RBS37_08800 [Bacteroidales bacterium]|jgi:hypothetical protein|nr:hypothetical protein [Bacteroidales bacterium]